jgi:hypothetical protein
MTHAEAIRLVARCRTHLSILKFDNATNGEKIRGWYLADVLPLVEMFEEILVAEEDERDEDPSRPA